MKAPRILPIYALAKALRTFEQKLNLYRWATRVLADDLRHLSAPASRQ